MTDKQYADLLRIMGYHLSVALFAAVRANRPERIGFAACECPTVQTAVDLVAHLERVLISADHSRPALSLMLVSRKEAVVRIEYRGGVA